MKIAEVISYLESIAPPVYQESYDNARLITGDKNREVTGVLTSLDAIEKVVDEAISQNCNLIVAHHPIVFKGLKSLTGANYVERTIIKAIKNDIAIYAIHTNLDNVLHSGVNERIADRLNLEYLEILAPKAVRKITSFAFPLEKEELIESAAEINRLDVVISTFEEIAEIEIVFDIGQQAKVMQMHQQFALNPSEELLISTIENKSPKVGSGIIGSLPAPMKELDFLDFVKDKMKVSMLRHTQLLGKEIQRVAICGGAGSFLLPKALARQADIFITADYKYHEFFDADGKIIIADIGHFESEQFTINLLAEIISKTFSKLPVYETKTMTNPVFYR